jgi:hypothetical protein
MKLAIIQIDATLRETSKWEGIRSREEVFERGARARPRPAGRAIYPRVPSGIGGSAKDAGQGLRRVYSSRGSRPTRIETCLSGRG